MKYQGMMFPGTPARGGGGDGGWGNVTYACFVTEFLTILKWTVYTTVHSFFHAVLNVKDVFDY